MKVPIERFNNGCCNHCDRVMMSYMMWEFWDKENCPLNEPCSYCGLPWQLVLVDE